MLPSQRLCLLRLHSICSTGPAALHSQGINSKIVQGIERRPHRVSPTSSQTIDAHQPSTNTMNPQLRLRKTATAPKMYIRNLRRSDETSLPIYFPSDKTVCNPCSLAADPKLWIFQSSDDKPNNNKTPGYSGDPAGIPAYHPCRTQAPHQSGDCAA